MTPAYRIAYTVHKLPEFFEQVEHQRVIIKCRRPDAVVFPNENFNR